MSGKGVKRTVLSLNDKHDVFLDIAANIQRNEICLKYKITNSTVSKILKNKTNIEVDFQQYDGVSYFSLSNE